MSQCALPDEYYWKCAGKVCTTCEYNKEITITPTGAFTLDDLLALHDSTCSNARAVMKAKNHDYTCGSVGVFNNFKASTILGVNPVQGVLVRCLDKFKRVQTYLTLDKLAVEGEGVLDAIDDVINYMILCKGIIIEEQRMKVVPAELPNVETKPLIYGELNG